jgi:ubiquinone/menaquinone biosynthesis C-methylase UbiE
MLALPPLDRDDHLVDVGAGTGKLASLIARSYPNLGHLTLMEPNVVKLARAETRLRELLPRAYIGAIPTSLGEDLDLPIGIGDYVTVGSVYMPIMLLRGGTLADGLTWLRRALADTRRLLKPGGWLYAVETLAIPWESGPESGPVRRLQMLEFQAELDRAGFTQIECVYRFRDRVALRAQKAEDRG